MNTYNTADLTRQAWLEWTSHFTAAPSTSVTQNDVQAMTTSSNARQPSALLYLAGHLTMQRKTESQSARVHCWRPPFNILRVLQEETSGAGVSCAGCSGSLSVLRKQVSFRNAKVRQHNGNILSR